MTTSDYDPESQAERRRVLVNDARVRATTMHQHAVAEASIETGRFTQVTVAHVVGSEPAVRYPAAVVQLLLVARCLSGLGRLLFQLIRTKTNDAPAIDSRGALSASENRHARRHAAAI